MDLLTISAIVIAAVAAFRSTWSPCGVSMLSSITPMSEHGRGHRYWGTVAWFLLGAVLGGVTLGALAALGARVMGSVGFSAEASALFVLLAGVITLSSDLGIAGFRLPANPRQVERTWLDKYRPWIYGVGFGWQLGVGVATYVMTASIYLMVIAAASTGQPLLAAAIVTGFGLLRGLAVLPPSGVDTPAQLARFHARMEGWRPLSRVVAVLGQISVVGLASAVAFGAAASAVAVLGLGLVAWMMREGLTDPTRRPQEQAPPRASRQVSVQSG